VKINGETHCLWQTVDHEDEVLESYVTKHRDRRAALKFLRKSMESSGQPQMVVTDKLRSNGAAMKEIGNASLQETGRWLKTGLRIHTCIFNDENGPCSGSGECDVCRNSPLSIPQFTPASITNAPTTAEKISNSIDPPRSPSGGSFVPPRFRHLAVNRDWFELV